MSPKRIQRKRTRGWRMPEGAVYVGRPSIYGNPFNYGQTPNLRRVAVHMFETWIAQETLDPGKWDGYSRIVPHVALKAALARGDLRGHDLVCWCPLNQPCHADVLIELANAGAS